MALFLLHVCPRRVINGRAFRHFNYTMKGRISAGSGGQYHDPAVNISLVKLIIVVGLFEAVRGLLSLSTAGCDHRVPVFAVCRHGFDTSPFSALLHISV